MDDFYKVLIKKLRYNSAIDAARIRQLERLLIKNDIPVPKSSYVKNTTTISKPKNTQEEDSPFKFQKCPQNLDRFSDAQKNELNSDSKFSKFSGGFETPDSFNDNFSGISNPVENLGKFESNSAFVGFSNVETGKNSPFQKDWTETNTNIPDTTEFVFVAPVPLSFPLPLSLPSPFDGTQWREGFGNSNFNTCSTGWGSMEYSSQKNDGCGFSVTTTGYDYRMTPQITSQMTSQMTPQKRPRKMPKKMP